MVGGEPGVDVLVDGALGHRCGFGSAGIVFLAVLHRGWGGGLVDCPFVFLSLRTARDSDCPDLVFLRHPA